MSKLSEKIVELRKKKGLTQEQLGKEFNVSAQAVSKWENGISEPDIETLKKMCELFEVSFDELIGNESKKQEEVAVSQAQVADAPQAQPSAQPSIIIGYCKDCKKPIYAEDKYETRTSRGTGTYLLCSDCDTKDRSRNAKDDYYECSDSRKKGLIWGTVTGVILLALYIVIAIVDGDPSMIGYGSIIAYGGFAFTACMFMSESSQDLMLFFCKSFRMPGVIFELSLDGLIWLLTVKLFLGILGFLLSIICFILGFIITFIYTMFAFPFVLARNIIVARKSFSEGEKILNEKK